VLDASAVHRLAKAASGSLLIIDFGLPPNIDPKAAKDSGLARIGMDEMIQAAQDRRLAQLMRLAPMRAAIDERLTRIREQLASRAIGAQLAQLRNSFERIASAEANRAIAEELHELEPQQQEQVRRLIETLAHKLAHLPLAGMRAAAPHANSETLEAFFREARLQREDRSASMPRNPKAPAPWPTKHAPSHAATNGVGQPQSSPSLQSPAMAHTSASSEKRSR
jgi:glutamyl-tRNA reductase